MLSNSIKIAKGTDYKWDITVPCKVLTTCHSIHFIKIMLAWDHNVTKICGTNNYHQNDNLFVFLLLFVFFF